MLWSNESPLEKHTVSKSGECTIHGNSPMHLRGEGDTSTKQPGLSSSGSDRRSKENWETVDATGDIEQEVEGGNSNVHKGEDWK